MIKLIVPLALLLLATLYKIWRDYEGDPKKAALDVALLLFLVGATLFGRYLRIYMPLCCTSSCSSSPGSATTSTSLAAAGGYG